MKNMLMILPLVLVLGFAFACRQAEQVAEEPAVDVEAEKAAILAVDVEFRDAMQAKDIDRTMSVFASDAVHVMDNDKFFDDRAGIRQWALNFMDTEWNQDWSVDKIVISNSGDMAYALIKIDHSRFREDETIQHLKLGTFCVYMKQLDGSWKIVAFR